jgi:hypothetical protein
VQTLRVALLLVAPLPLVVAWGGSARADAALEGAWTTGGVTETFTVQQWSQACGPPPVSGTLLPAGPVTVQSDGPELVLSAPGKRTLRTDQCLDAMPTLARTSHTQDGRSWRTRCATPPSDPRHAVINTAYFLAPGDDSISVAETGRYELAINDARCIADVKRSGVLTRVAAPAPAPAASATTAPALATTAPPTAGRVDCRSPGAPARLEVRPSRKLLRTGDTFTFRGVVLDAGGCITATPIQWTVSAVSFADGQAHAAQPTIDARGALHVPSRDFGDATFDVVATAGGRSARAAVEVTSPDHYDALLAQSGLDSNGERDEPSVAVLATSAIGARDVTAAGGARRRRITFVAIVGSLTLALGALALVGRRRARKAREAERAAEQRHAEKMREYERVRREREERHAAEMKKHLESVALAQQQAAAAAARGVDSGPMFCPCCRRELPAGSAFCPFDANRLVAITGHEDVLAGPPGGICPTCKRGFNPGVKVCPHDGDDLVPPPLAGEPSAPVAPPRGKICPTCGGRFDGSAGFCGKDGTQLVLLN